ncbi:MAG: hypothetical protein IIB65_06575 [Proteobacteria bacterium]|nr:hypothetical protein [Pseudomonadota bacterium]
MAGILLDLPVGGAAQRRLAFHVVDGEILAVLLAAIAPGAEEPRHRHAQRDVFVVVPGVERLLHFRRRRHFRKQDGAGLHSPVLARG